MAIIYTYPTVTPTVSDLIVLSDLSINGKPTKTCTIESVLDLSSSAVTTLTSITHIERGTAGTLTIDTTNGGQDWRANNGSIVMSTTGTGGDVKIEPTGNIKLGGTVVGTPAAGDVLVAKDITGNVEWGSSTVQTTKVSLSNAEIQALDVTPIELIPAPGAGKFIQILSIYGFLDYTAPAFNAVELRVRYNGSITNITYFRSVSFTSQSADAKEVADLSYTTWNDNTKVEIYASGATGAGGSTIDVYVTYKIITV